jgi:hypothetical protein
MLYVITDILLEVVLSTHDYPHMLDNNSLSKIYYDNDLSFLTVINPELQQRGGCSIGFTGALLVVIV